MKSLLSMPQRMVGITDYQQQITWYLSGSIVEQIVLWCIDQCGLMCGSVSLGPLQVINHIDERYPQIQYPVNPAHQC